MRSNLLDPLEERSAGCFTALTADATGYGRLGRFCLPEARRGGLEDQLGAVGGDLLIDLRPAQTATQARSSSERMISGPVTSPDDRTG